MTKIFQIILALATFACACNSATADGSPQIKKLYDAGQGYYAYAPSAFEDIGGKRHLFFCKNATAGTIMDCIFYASAEAPKYRWRKAVKVLEPSKNGTAWDSFHVCDPDVRECKIKVGKTQYNYIMSYLGTNRADCTRNQIGLAFAKKIGGPYVRYAKNPIIKCEEDGGWGVGQSDSTVIADGTIEIYYTKGEKEKTSIYKRQISFENPSTIEVGDEEIIGGLTYNTHVAFSDKYCVAAAPCDSPKAGTNPPVCKNSKLIYVAKGAEKTARKQDWKQIAEISKADTKFEYNHNAAILTDPRGKVLIKKTEKGTPSAEMLFSVSNGGGNWLWEYSIYSAKIDLPEEIQ